MSVTYNILLKEMKKMPCIECLTDISQRQIIVMCSPYGSSCSPDESSPECSPWTIDSDDQCSPWWNCNPSDP